MKSVACCWLAFAALLPAQNVTYDRLVHALDEQQNWLTYWGDYSAMRHRDLNQINTSNVKNLRVDWIYQTGQAGSFEAMPLVVDGVMYVTAANGYAYALDARSGRQLWLYNTLFRRAGKRTASIAASPSWAISCSW
jgi:alcohol dehydrogenase (cytochrome c)